MFAGLALAALLNQTSPFRYDDFAANISLTLSCIFIINQTTVPASAILAVLVLYAIVVIARTAAVEIRRRWCRES
jgi:hypothetical protein